MTVSVPDLPRGFKNWYSDTSQGIKKTLNDLADDVNALISAGVTADLFLSANVQSSAVDIDLSELKNFQFITMSTSSKTLKFPDVQTQSFDGATIVVVNEGAEAFDIDDNADGLIINLAAGATVTLMLKADATAAGTWVVKQYLLNMVEDTTPQWGGNVDVNGKKLVSASDGDIEVEPDGTGEILLTGPTKARSPIITDATTARTIGLTDTGAYIRFTNGAAITLTIPTNAATAFPIGTEIIGIQAGAGVITVAGAGVTINSKDSFLDTAGQYATVCLKKVATDTWDVFGDLT